MTDCPNGEMRDLLPDLLHDRLAPAVRAEVEAHVASCDDCRAELALLGALRRSLVRGRAVDVAGIASAIPAHRAPARRSWVGWRAAAAVVILAAGGTSVAVLQRDAGAGRDSVRAVAPAGSEGVAQIVAEPARTPVESAPAPVAAPVPAAAARTVVASRELALGNAAIGDLDDGELSALLADLESLEVLPSSEVEQGTVISPVAPSGTE